jgi:hypothetical protein
MLTLPYVLAAMIALAGGVEQARLDTRISASAVLKSGDSEARVLEVLGPPLETWKPRSATAAVVFGKRPAQWLYGTVIDGREVVNSEGIFPNFFAVKLRLFSPDDGDLVIDWGEDGVVAAVKRP